MSMILLGELVILLPERGETVSILCCTSPSSDAAGHLSESCQDDAVIAVSP